MTSFTYYPTIPTAPDNPSFDQPLMQINSTSINGLVAVDHVTFNATGSGGPGTSGGQHLQVTFNGKNVPGSPPTDPLSIMYTNNVNAAAFNTASASTVAEVFYSNANTIYPVSMIKAFGCFDNTGTSLNTWNLALKTVGGHPTTGDYIMTMPTNCVTGDNYSVIVTPQASTSGDKSQVSVAYSISTATQFNIQFGIAGSGFFDPDQFSVIVLQL